MSYDPQARRDTPLALKLKARIRERGPMLVREFMDACLNDAEHGYYRTQTVIGRAGDFVTAPEISQVFGELIGLWAAVVWQQMGRPTTFNLVELGPGRGSMMADALRAAAIVPGFLEGAQVILVEQSSTLRDMQARTLETAPKAARWVSHLGQLLMPEPDMPGARPRETPTIVVANEFLDCLPQEQLVRQGDGWLQRRIGLDGDDRLIFEPARARADEAPPRAVQRAEFDGLYPGAGDGDVLEPGHHGWIDEALAPWVKLAALFIDYGYAQPAVGDSLQAVRAHAWEHPLTSPGEADLTMHVDFAAVSRRARLFEALRVDGPVTQAEFLGSLGIIPRASRLMAANPALAASIEAGVARLMAPQGMGSRFKAIGIRSAGLPPLPGLATVDKAVRAP